VSLPTKQEATEGGDVEGLQLTDARGAHEARKLGGEGKTGARAINQQIARSEQSTRKREEEVAPMFRTVEPAVSWGSS
jgi:hypothetical protein